MVSPLNAWLRVAALTLPCMATCCQAPCPSHYGMGRGAARCTEARRLWDAGKGGVWAGVLQDWHPQTRQRYWLAVNQLVATKTSLEVGLGLDEVLALCSAKKADASQSASGMKGFFFAMQALENCGVPSFGLMWCAGCFVGQSLALILVCLGGFSRGK